MAFIEPPKKPYYSSEPPESWDYPRLKESEGSSRSSPSARSSNSYGGASFRHPDHDEYNKDYYMRNDYKRDDHNRDDYNRKSWADDSNKYGPGSEEFTGQEGFNYSRENVSIRRSQPTNAVRDREDSSTQARKANRSKHSMRTRKDNQAAEAYKERDDEYLT